MLKNILVALDQSPSSEKAKIYAINLAKKMGTHVTGIAVLDEPWITAPEAVPIGGAAFKVELDTKLLEDAKHRLHKLEEEFLNTAEAASCKAQLIEMTGMPSTVIEHMITPYDLLVIGKDADFHFSPHEGTAISVEHLIKENPRPIIVTGAESQTDGGQFLMAYDGTFASSRTLHMAILLGIAQEGKTHIVAVGKEKAHAKHLLDQASDLCKRHGITPVLHPIESSANPAEAILALSDEIKPGLLGSGAFGQKGFLHFLSGSCAKALLASSKTPLFLYH